jgi:hypothetical protein
MRLCSLLLLHLLSSTTLVVTTPIATSPTITELAPQHSNHSSTSPLTPRADPILPAKPGSFSMCTAPHWTGECAVVNLKMPECWNIRKPFRGNVASISPNEWRGRPAFQYDCAVFDEPGCMGSGEVLKWPGTGELGREIWSIRCEYSNLEELERLKKTKTGGFLVLDNLMRMGD